MAAKDFLLQHSPVWFQNLGISAFGYTWYKRRYGGIFDAELKEFTAREAYTAGQWHDYQEQEMRKLLVHAFNTTPLYSQKLKDAGFNGSTLAKFTLADIKKLPFLEKDELRQFGTTTLLSSVKEKGGQFFSSSGSTGTPCKILYSHAMHQRLSAAYEARVRHWAGVDRAMARGMIGGRRIIPTGNARPPYYRYNFAERQVYFSAYHIAPANVANYLEAIGKYKLDYMVGYAVSNYILARFIDEQGLRAPELKAVITSSEKLTPEMRAMFKRVYNCRTFDGWSGVENCGLISECEMGSLHISPDIGYIEILDERGQDVKPGGRGEVVCTGFINYGQPLIRYKIGDSVEAMSQPCPCGRAMPVIKEIVGRVEDVVVGPDGRQMVRFHGIYINIPAIRAGQIIQHTTDHITIRLAVDHRLTSEDEAAMRTRVISQLGPVKVDFDYVDQLPVNSNGKVKAVISHLR